MNRRLEKVNELLQQTLSKLIQAEIKKERNIFVTVQEVKTASNLKTAKVWISLFGKDLKDSEKDEIIQELQNKTAKFQHQIATTIDLKFTPKLTFKLDTSAEILQKIDELVEKSKKNHN